MSFLKMHGTAAPSTPATGSAEYWTSSTDKRLHFIDESGATGTVGGPPQGWFNVQDYNVLPANSGGTNVTNLNALLSTAGSGATIYFPGGTYNFNAKITVPAKAFTFRGMGGAITGGFTILNWSSIVGDHLIQLTSSNWYTQFYDLVFTSSVVQSAGAAIYTNSNVGTHIKNCTFGALGGTLFNVIDMTGTNSGENTVIDTVEIGGYTGTGININGTLTSPVIANTVIQGVWGTSVQTATAGINIQNAGAVQIDNSDVIGANNNLLINPSVGIVVASVYCTNTYFDNSNGSCIKISGAGATVRCRFISCSVTTSATTTALSAIEISSTNAYSTGQGIDFENCSIINTFATTGTTNGFNITGGADFAIIACRIAGWTNGINITPIATNGITKPFITDCTIGATAGYPANTVGLLLNAGAAQYGQIMVQNNQFLSNTTPITDNSTLAASNAKIIGGNSGMSAAPAAKIAASGAINTTETYVLTALPLPANSLSVGTTIRATLVGTCTTTAANVSTFTVRVGTTGTTPASDTTATSALATGAAGTTGTNTAFTVTITITCRAIGASTLLECAMGALTVAGSGLVTAGSSVTVAATGTFNNNAALFLNVSYKSAATTTTSTFQIAYWEVVQQ